MEGDSTTGGADSSWRVVRSGSKHPYMLFGDKGSCHGPLSLPGEDNRLHTCFMIESSIVAYINKWGNDISIFVS